MSPLSEDEVNTAQVESLLVRIKATRDYTRSLETAMKHTNDTIQAQYESIATMKRLLLQYGWKGTSC